MSDWTIGKRLTAGFAAIVGVTFALGVFASWKVSEIHGYSAAITQDSLPGVYNIGQLEATARENYTLTLRHVAARDAAARAAVEAEMARLVERIDAIVDAYEKTITQARDRELFTAVAPARAEFLRVRNDVVLPASRAASPDAMVAVEQQLDPAFTKYLATVRTLVDWNKANGDANATAISGAVSSATFGIIAGIAVAVALAAGLGFVIVRSTTTVLGQSVAELTEGAQQVASASSQVSGASQSLSQGATEQAASLEETSASMEEMASMTRKNAENSQQAAALVSETSRLVHGANSALTEMTASMSAIKESSDKVSKIIKTIDEIAFQTNILALNAAVEAARAGEAGMGFAVVADEVRALAHRSAQAAKDTAGLIEESIVRSQEGQRKVQDVSQAIESITTSTVQVKGLVDQVSEASRQQAQGIDQVSQAIAQMEKVTQGTAATAEESAAASEELNAQAETSLHVVARLAALLGGAAARAPVAKKTAPRGSVLAMVSRKPTPTMARPAGQQIPLRDTGTYGAF